jgi:type II secretion system protein N
MASAAKNKKLLGYTLYVVFVTLALLYFLFPAQALEEFVDNSVSRIDPELGFKAEKIKPWIPFGFLIDSGRIFMRNTGSPPIFKADSLYIGPHILRLVRGDYALDLSATAYHGDIKGTLHYQDKDGPALAGELTFKDLDFADYKFLAEKLKHTLTGSFSGNMVYAREPGDAVGNGKADMRLTDGRLQFQTPVFGIDAVDLQNIELELELRNGEITIARGELAGPEVKASMTGSIQLQPDINGSRLNLKGTLEPLAEFYKNYPEIRELLKSMKKRVRRGQYSFAITGTLGKPRFKLL